MGQNILDQSKYLMYDFHYGTMLPHFGRENIDLLFTDTDSLCYHIKNKDPFEFMKEKKSLFDLSNYDRKNDLYDTTNKKVIGKFKNESIKQITEFVGLRSKCYSNKNHHRCKGVKRGVVENEIIFKNYKDVLFDRIKISKSQNGFRSYKHQIYTETINKIALSYNDDKSYICDNNIDCITFGHYKIKK